MVGFWLDLLLKSFVREARKDVFCLGVVMTFDNHDVVITNLEPGNPGM